MLSIDGRAPVIVTRVDSVNIELLDAILGIHDCRGEDVDLDSSSTVLGLGLDKVSVEYGVGFKEEDFYGTIESCRGSDFGISKKMGESNHFTVGEVNAKVQQPTGILMSGPGRTGVVELEL